MNTCNACDAYQDEQVAGTCSDHAVYFDDLSYDEWRDQVDQEAEMRDNELYERELEMDERYY